MGSCILAKLIFRLLSHSGLFWLTLHEPFASKSMWEILVCQSLGQKFPGYIWNEILTLLISKGLTNAKALNKIGTQKLLPHNYFLTGNHWRFFRYLEAIQPKNIICSPVLTLSEVVSLTLVKTHNGWYNLTQKGKLQSVKSKWKGKGVLFFLYFRVELREKEMSLSSATVYI